MITTSLLVFIFVAIAIIYVLGMALITISTPTHHFEGHNPVANLDADDDAYIDKLEYYLHPHNHRYRG